jgi:hypothetical protein
MEWLLSSIKSTIQSSRPVMINSESMGMEEASGNDARVSKHPDLEANMRFELDDLLIVSAGICASTSGRSDRRFSGLSLRLNANFGFVPVEVWFICSFSKVCSHDFNCLNAGHIINDQHQGYRERSVPFRTVAGRKGEGTGVRPRIVFSEGPIGLITRRRGSSPLLIAGW